MEESKQNKTFYCPSWFKCYTELHRIFISMIFNFKSILFTQQLALHKALAMLKWVSLQIYLHMCIFYGNTFTSAISATHKDITNFSGKYLPDSLLPTISL